MRAGAPQGVKIIAVFDGESSTDKSLEDAERRKRRQKAQVGIEVQRTTPDAGPCRQQDREYAAIPMHVRDSLAVGGKVRTRTPSDRHTSDTHTRYHRTVLS